MDSSPSEVGANKKLNAMPIEDLTKENGQSGGIRAVLANILAPCRAESGAACDPAVL